MIIGVLGAAPLCVLRHRHHITVGRLDAGQRGVNVISVGCPRLGGFNCLLRNLLCLRVQGGVNLQTTALQHGVALNIGGTVGLILQDIIHHVVAEEGVLASVAAPLLHRVNVQVHFAGHCLVVLLLRDLPVTQHGGEHHITAFNCVIRVLVRPVGVGGLHQPGQQGRLSNVQVLRRNTPVVLGCGLNTKV